MNFSVTDEMVHGMDDMADLPRARATDPSTSHAAAAEAQCFAHTHAGRILSVLRHEGSGTAEWIAKYTGLTVVQIDRRLPEMAREGLIRTTGATHNGYRAWEAI